MKKILSVTLVLIMIFSLTGCSMAKKAASSAVNKMENIANDLENNAEKHESDDVDKAAKENTEKVKDVLNGIDWDNLPNSGIGDLLGGLLDGDSSSEGSDSSSSGKKTGGYNIEYEVYGYKLEGEDEITYYNENNNNMWTKQMIIMCDYSTDELQYWTSFLGYNVGDESYGKRPVNEPSGELTDWFQYDNTGNITGENRSLYVYYDYDSPVIEDLDTHEKYYFRRTSDKWEWGN